MADSNPFVCKAEIVGLDGSIQVITIYLSLKIDTLKAWNDGEGTTRSQCNVLAEQVETQIGSGPGKADVLHLQDIRLQIGPSIAGFLGTDKEKEQWEQSFDALRQSPQLTDIVISEYTEGAETALDLRGGFPALFSAGLGYKMSNSIKRPIAAVGFDLFALEIDTIERYQFMWRYRPQPTRAPLPRALKQRCVVLSNHQGRFSYVSTKVPPSMRVEIIATCGLPRSDSALAAWCRKVFIHDRKKNYPCTQIRLRLQVDVLPTDSEDVQSAKVFQFPHENAAGRRLHLGKYSFREQKDQLLLHAARGESTVEISSSSQTYQQIYEEGAWKVAATSPNDFVAKAQSQGRIKFPTEGELEVQ